MLRNIKGLTGQPIQATDGELGKVCEFYFGDRTWRIRYLVVETGNWLSGRKVLISPHWIKKVVWETSEIFVDLSREAVSKSPEFDPAQPVSEDYESALYDHYGRPKLEDETKP